LLDLEFRDITGPLAQFQAKKVDKAGVSEVIHSLNQTANHGVPETREKQLFDALWPELEKTVANIPKQPAAAKHTRPQHEVLEELVASVRSLDARVRETAEALPRSRKYRPRFHPFIFHDLFRLVSDRPNDPIRFLIFGSMFREEAPWLYELAMEVYRASRSGRPEEAHRALKRFQRAMELMEHGFPLEELGLDPKAFHMLSSDVRHLLLEAEPPIAHEKPVPDREISVGDQQPQAKKRRRRRESGTD
jgi:hypothetical protein